LPLIKIGLVIIGIITLIGGILVAFWKRTSVSGAKKNKN
jgi:hypothetical protein